MIPRKPNELYIPELGKTVSIMRSFTRLVRWNCITGDAHVDFLKKHEEATIDAVRITHMLVSRDVIDALDVRVTVNDAVILEGPAFLFEHEKEWLPVRHAIRPGDELHARLEENSGARASLTRPLAIDLLLTVMKPLGTP